MVGNCDEVDKDVDGMGSLRTVAKNASGDRLLGDGRGGKGGWKGAICVSGVDSLLDPGKGPLLTGIILLLTLCPALAVRVVDGDEHSRKKEVLLTGEGKGTDTGVTTSSSGLISSSSVSSCMKHLESSTLSWKIHCAEDTGWQLSCWGRHPWDGEMGVFRMSIKGSSP
jgi:hypothetical protein